MDTFDKIKELNIEVLDTSFSECKYLVIYKQRSFEINKTVFDLLTILQKTDTLDKAAEEYSDLQGVCYTSADLLNIINKKISILFQESITSKRKQFIYSICLLPPNTVDKISSIFQFLYRGKAYIYVYIVNIILASFFLINHYEKLSFSLTNLDLYKFILVFIILFLSTFFHELGHASASKYCGVPPGEIGFGIYINIPVFYTDVTNIWKLSRKQRLLVNIGGVYFQCLLLIPCYFLYHNVPNSLIGYLILATNLNFLFVLNPFFKFDGYWIISDLLGIPNLRKRTNELFFYFVKKGIGNMNLKKPDLLNLKLSIKIIAIIYTIITTCFMTTFFAFFIPWFIYKFIDDIPLMIALFEEEIALKGAFPFDVLFYFLPKLILVLFIIYFISKQLFKFTTIVIDNIKHSSFNYKN